MSNITNKLAVVGMTNVTARAISKGVAFVGAILLAAGTGGMMMSTKYFTEEEMKYLTTQMTSKK